MDSVEPSDRSVNGLVVFLTLSVFLAMLTSGLIVCLVKIWCGDKRTRTRTLTEQQRPSVAAGSKQESESDDEPTPSRRTPSVRRFSRRIINMVQRGSERRPTREQASPETLTAPPLPVIHGATDDSNVVKPGGNPVEISINDPSCVIYL